MTDFYPELATAKRQSDVENEETGKDIANISRISKSNSNLFFKSRFGGLAAVNRGEDQVTTARERLLSECLISDKESLQFSDFGGLELQSACKFRPLALRRGMVTDDQGFTTNYDESAATDNNDLRSILKGITLRNDNGPQGILAPAMGKRQSQARQPYQRGQEDMLSIDFSMSEREQGLTSGVEALLEGLMSNPFTKLGQVPAMTRAHTDALAPIDELPGYAQGQQWSKSPRSSALKDCEYPMPVRQNDSIP